VPDGGGSRKGKRPCRNLSLESNFYTPGVFKDATVFTTIEREEKLNVGCLRRD